MDRREKKPLSPKGRKFNIILTVVALILVVAVGGVTTYSWIEQSTDMNVNLDEGNIKRNPENYDKYLHNLSVGEDIGSKYISLNEYADFVDGIKLSQVSSADGENFYYKKGADSYIKLDKNYRDVSYIAFDINITSTCNKDTYFFFDENFIQSVYGDNSVSESLRMAIKRTIDSSTETTIFSNSGAVYSPANSTTGTTTVDPKAFSECVSETSPIFTLGGNKTAKVEITIWLEGEDTSDDTLIASNTGLNVNFQINTNWYDTSNKYIYIYDGTVEQFMADCSTGTYKAYNSQDREVGSGNLVNLYSENNQVKKTAIISDITNVTRVEFEFSKPGTQETHTYSWYADGRTSETEVYYTIIDYTKDAE
ncbi:MAG: hypothetical protein ACI4HZ_09075 [Ruminococcus sp.]